MSAVVLVDTNEWEVREINNEPCVKDTVLAERLGYKEPKAIRRLIKRMIGVGAFGGGIPCPTLETISGNETEVFYLNEKQSLKVIAKSETETADKIMDQVIDVFIAYRNRKLTLQVPNFSNPAEAARAWALEYEQKQIALIQRDEAIEQKLWIGNKREATAMATASAEKRRANTLQIELDKSKEWASVKKMEHHFKRSFRWQELKKVSIAMNYEIKKIEDQNYPAGVNLYHMDVWLETYGVWIDENVA